MSIIEEISKLDDTAVKDFNKFLEEGMDETQAAMKVLLSEYEKLLKVTMTFNANKALNKKQNSIYMKELLEVKKSLKL